MNTLSMFAKKYLLILLALLVGLNTGFLYAQARPSALETNPQTTILLNRTFADALRGTASLNAGPSHVKSIFYRLLQEQQLKKQGSVVGMFLTALVSGALGYLGGGFLGYAIESSKCSDNGEEFFCGVGGFLIGASAGGALMMPLGTHVVNGRRGKLGATLLATLAATGLAWGIAAANNSAEGLLVMVPLFQITTSIAVERITGRNR